MSSKKEKILERSEIRCALKEVGRAKCWVLVGQSQWPEPHYELKESR